jgi:N-glycosylase/DNA lyase
MKLPGVGPKIADCILLYGFGMLEAVPLDVHIKRQSEKLFGWKFESWNLNTYKKLGKLWRQKFGKFAGLVQQYIYMDSRKTNG